MDIWKEAKRLRQSEHYDELMEAKEREFPYFTSKQFLVMLVLHELIDNKVPMKDYIQSVPKDCIVILKGIIRDRIHKPKITIGWDAVLNALSEASPYDKAYADYLHLFTPMRVG